VESITSRDWIALSPSLLSASELIAWATRPACGAVVSFSGTVRETSGTLHGVLALEYETSEEMAKGRLEEIIAQARNKWPTLGAIAIHHRTGQVELGGTAVVVVASSPHRYEAFEGAQFCIDTVKDCLPMWKREFWEGGSAWSHDARTILNVTER
jgi:molybdopterin synthase catalytic subunit